MPHKSLPYPCWNVWLDHVQVLSGQPRLLWTQEYNGPAINCRLSDSFSFITSACHIETQTWFRVSGDEIGNIVNLKVYWIIDKCPWPLLCPWSLLCDFNTDHSISIGKVVFPIPYFSVPSVCFPPIDLSKYEVMGGCNGTYGIVYMAIQLLIHVTSGTC